MQIVTPPRTTNLVVRENKAFDTLRARILGRYGKARSTATTAEWIAANTLLKNRPWSFEGHEYQIMPLNDLHKRVASHKPAQVGWTEMFIRWILRYSVEYQGFTTILTQPKKLDAEDFSKGRARDAIMQCDIAQSMLRAGDLDSATVKRIGLSYIYFKGTVGKSAAISVPADALVHDETNFSAPNTMDKFKSRIQHSLWGFIRNISTPTIPKFGVSAMYDDSDKKRILWRCKSCREWQRLKWPNSIYVKLDGEWSSIGEAKNEAEDFTILERAKDLRRRGNPCSATYRCYKCGKEIQKEDNWEWVAEYPGVADYAGGVSGYAMSQMDVGWIAPWDIICASDYSLKGYKSFADFMNFVMGEPTLDAKDGVVEADFKGIVDSSTPQQLTSWGSFIGIDVGLQCHATIMQPPTYTGQDLIIRQYKFPAEAMDSHVTSMIKNYNPFAVVIDAMPYELDVNRVIKKFPSLVHKARYKEGKSRYDDEVNEIKADRTVSIDLVVNKVKEKAYLYLGDISETISHFGNIARMQEEDELGNIKFEWINTGPDHYVHSQVLAELAREVIELKQEDGEPGVMLPSIGGVRLAI